MKIYVDLVLLTNFILDFFLLACVWKFQKKETKLYRLFFASFLGALSVLFLFLPLTKLSLFCLKVLTSFMMVYVSFPFFDVDEFLKDVICLYIFSVFLGGSLSLLTSFTFEYDGLILLSNSIPFSLLFILCVSPIFLGWLLQYFQKEKYLHNFSRCLEVILFGKKYRFRAYIDTGNQLCYFGHSVILLYIPKFYFLPQFYIPYESISGKGVLKAYKVDVRIDQQLFLKRTVAIVNHPFKVSSAQAILPPEYL